jgi:hypothetical protein
MDRARLRENEKRFRRGNDALERAVDQMGISSAEAISFVCECSRPACFAEVVLRPLDYRHVRASGDLYVLVDGHEDPAIDEVVGRLGRYLIVKKRDG